MDTRRSIRPSLGAHLGPALVGTVLAIVATILATRLVAPRVASMGGWYTRWDQSFVGMIGAAGFFLGFFGTIRLTRKPRPDERSWMLSMAQVVPTAQSYREASAPNVQDLIARLAAHGYQLEATQVDESRNPAGAGDGRAPLTGSAIELRDRRLPGGARVIVQVSQRAAGEGGGLGIVTAEGGRKRAAEEMALFTICELAQLLPGLRYKDADSALEPDTTEMLRASLPDRPRAL